MNARKKYSELALLAMRTRAGIIGTLESCRCTYPNEQHSTSTGHELWCPAHTMTLSSRELKTTPEFVIREAPPAPVVAPAEPLQLALEIDRAVRAGDEIRVRGCAAGAWERVTVSLVKGGSLHFRASDGANGVVSTSDHGIRWERAS